MSIRLVDTTNPACSSGVLTLFNSGNSIKDLMLASRFRIHFIGMYFAVVGPEWDSGGKTEGDFLHHIDISLSGRRQVVWQNEVMEAEPGDVHFWPGNTPLARRCQERSEVLFFKFRCEWLPGVDPLLDWSLRRPLRIERCDTSYWRQYADDRGPIRAGKLFELQAQLQMWLAKAVADLDQLIDGHLSTHARFIPAFQMTEDQLGADLRVEDLARACGTQKDAFARSFTRNTGITPKDFLSRRVNQKAIECVVNTDLKMKEIAHLLRFNDEFHFSRFFQKLNGAPPSRYRLRFQMARERDHAMRHEEESADQS